MPKNAPWPNEGRPELPQEGDVDVEMLVVDELDQLAVHDLRQDLQVDHHARLRRRHARDGDLDVVVVSVAVQIVAFAEHPVVLLHRPGRVIQPVCGCEVGFAGDVDHRNDQFRIQDDE